MFTQNNIPAFIAKQLPELGAQPSAYKAIQALTDHTRRLAFEHDFKKVKSCLTLVERIYREGNTFVKNAVENIFIFSFSSLLANCNRVEWRIVQSYMPSDLYALYARQVSRPGC
jgi:hypothetical protein